MYVYRYKENFFGKPSWAVSGLNYRKPGTNAGWLFTRRLDVCGNAYTATGDLNHGGIVYFNLERAS